MVLVLQDLKKNHHVIGIKAEFEAEGTRLEEAIMIESAFVLRKFMKVAKIIRQTQRNFFGEKLVACSSGSGVLTPSFVKLAAAFGFETAIIENGDDMEKQISEVLSHEGQVVCEAMLIHDYIFQPETLCGKIAGRQNNF